MAPFGPWQGSSALSHTLLQEECVCVAGGEQGTKAALSSWMNGYDNQNGYDRSYFLGTHPNTLIVLPWLSPPLALDPASKAHLSHFLFPESAMSGNTGMLMIIPRERSRGERLSLTG